MSVRSALTVPDALNPELTVIFLSFGIPYHHTGSSGSALPARTASSARVTLSQRQ